MNRLRYVAYLTIVGGILLLGRVAAAVVAEFDDGFRLPLLTIAILVSALSLAGAIVWAASLHLQQRSRRSAVRLAVAASAVAFLVWPGSGAHQGGKVVAAFLVYLLVVRPAIRAAFRDVEKNA